MTLYLLIAVAISQIYSIYVIYRKNKEYNELYKENINLIETSANLSECLGQSEDEVRLLEKQNDNLEKDIVTLIWFIEKFRETLRYADKRVDELEDRVAHEVPDESSHTWRKRDRQFVSDCNEFLKKARKDVK